MKANAPTQRLSTRRPLARLAKLAISGVLAAGVLCLSLLAPGTAAAAPQPLWTACAGAAGDLQCMNPRGVAADRENGHVFVADQGGRRIVEYNAVGQMVKTWGWDVVESGPGDTGTGFEICVPRNGDVCKAGIAGGGVGQFTLPQGVALDSDGNVYVAEGEFGSRRVQKFNPDAGFVVMFGGHVNKTKVEAVAPESEQNRCPINLGDECQAATEGSGNGQFGEWVGGDFIAITPTDKVYVGDQNRIQRFDTGGVYQDECAVPGTVQSLAVDTAGNLYVAYRFEVDVRKLTFVAGGECQEVERFEIPKVGKVSEVEPIPTAVAVDASGHVYAFCCPERTSGSPTPVDPIFKFDPEGNIVDQFGKGEFTASTGLATNLCEGSEPPGNVYVTNLSFSSGFLRAYGTPPFGCFKVRTLPATEIEETTATLNGTVNPGGAAVSECRFEYGPTDTYGSTIPCTETPAEIGTGTEPVAVHADPSGLARATFYHFRLAANVAGEAEAGADEEFKTKGPPVISGDHTASVSDTEALLKAVINPEGLATTYRFEYGLTTAYGQSTPLRSVGGDRSEHPVSVLLEGLEPHTTYHWRIIATNSSDTSAGANHVFVTHRPAGSDPDTCPNKALRSGAAALLPDCRSYELVSPLDKNGGDIITGIASLSDPGGYVQASPDGNRITYTALTSFADQPNSFLFNQYLASREEGDGWRSEGIHPPVVNRAADSVLFGHLRDFMAFTPDLCNAWLIDYQTPPLTPEAQLDYRNLFRRDNCEPDLGDLEALTFKPPTLPESTREDYVDQYSVQGISEDGRHALFTATAALSADAAPQDNDTQIYDRFCPLAPSAVCALDTPGARRTLTSVLPHGGADPAAAAVGSGWFSGFGNAVSGDGARVYWTSLFGSDSTASTGRIYLRENPEQEQSAQALGSATGSSALIGPASGSGELTAGSNEVKNVSTSSGGFAVGQTIQGIGVTAGATITEVSGTTLKLSGSATVSGTVPLTGLASKEVREVTTSSGAFVVGQTVAAEGIPFGTTIEAVGAGTLTLSENATQTRTGATLEGFSKCSEPPKACTVPVSVGERALFWAAVPDGSSALYSEGDLGKGEATLQEFRLDGEGEPTRRVVAEDIRGVAGVSEDLSRVYFASEEALAGAGQNSQGAEPQAGEPNLYLQDGGTLHFIATLAEGDVGGAPYDIASRLSYFRATRVTPDGSRIAFQSRAPITGFDNTDAANGKADVEVFLYEAGGELTCVSCNPSGARPQGGLLELPYALRGEGSGTNIFAAAWIPTWEHSLHASNVLSGDGRRLFFNSYDPLLPRDTNGAMDVYEWEEAGKGSCTESDRHYFPQNGGCLYLISSGDSPHESEFWEASPDGEDVFFTTASSFAPGDPGLVDLYDARVGGGFAAPIEEVECEGETCQSPPPPPDFGAPASSAYRGPGNVKQPPPSCRPKAKRAKRLSRQAKRLRRTAKRARSPQRGNALRHRAKRATKRARRLSKRAKRCRAQRMRSDRRASR